MKTLTGKIALHNLPPYRGLSASIAFFPVQDENAVKPFGGDPPGNEIKDSEIVFEAVDLANETVEATRDIPFSLARPASYYYIQLRACSGWNSLYSDVMTQAVAHILEEAAQLSASERAELADRIMESLAHDAPADIAAAQITEVRRRIAEVESGEVLPIPGDEALAHVRRIVAAARTVS